MPDFLPRQSQPIIPGSRYYSESVESYRPRNDAVSGRLDEFRPKTVDGNEGILLAINKILGTAPARSGPDRTSMIPSDASYAKAVELVKGAHIPTDAPQDKVVEMLKAYMNQAGINLQ